MRLDLAGNKKIVEIFNNQTIEPFSVRSFHFATQISFNLFFCSQIGVQTVLGIGDDYSFVSPKYNFLWNFYYRRFLIKSLLSLRSLAFDSLTFSMLADREDLDLYKKSLYYEITVSLYSSFPSSPQLSNSLFAFLYSIGKARRGWVDFFRVCGHSPSSH